jgi:hypothetical protein
MSSVESVLGGVFLLCIRSQCFHCDCEHQYYHATVDPFCANTKESRSCEIFIQALLLVCEGINCCMLSIAIISSQTMFYVMSYYYAVLFLIFRYFSRAHSLQKKLSWTIAEPGFYFTPSISPVCLCVPDAQPRTLRSHTLVSIVN